MDLTPGFYFLRDIASCGWRSRSRFYPPAFLAANTSPPSFKHTGPTRPLPAPTQFWSIVTHANSVLARWLISCMRLICRQTTVVFARPAIRPSTTLLHAPTPHFRMTSASPQAKRLKMTGPLIGTHKSVPLAQNLLQSLTSR